MNFSQGWDTGFKAVLIYIGVVFFWLMVVEKLISSTSVSVIFMNLVAFTLAGFFFVWRRQRYITLKRVADA